MEHLTAYKMAQELRAEQAQELVQGAIANAKKSVAMSM
jgi:hypothetical protein